MRRKICTPARSETGGKYCFNVLSIKHGFVPSTCWVGSPIRRSSRVFDTSAPLPFHLARGGWFRVLRCFFLNITDEFARKMKGEALLRARFSNSSSKRGLGGAPMHSRDDVRGD